ncbi:MAG TPA: 2'-5' RNA ligase family protein [Bryobacteraceae bacterium]|nr:2'-5' RNA ligase family protein [Bryobacteraceae bacterium]
MPVEADGAQRINSFALVSYIPDPLGSFLDRLRHELVPRCSARAHVTVLPPRPLIYPPHDAWEELQAALEDVSPFTLTPTQVEIFPVTSVIYLGIGNGFQRLKDLHRMLNRFKLAFDEPFEFHPHITLAQDISHDDVEKAAQLAQRRWAEFPGDRRIRVQSLTFVQNTISPEPDCNKWVDLSECALGTHQHTGC